MSVKIIFFVLISLMFSLNRSFSGDWPMWRYDAGRTAASPEQLESELNLHWILQFTPRESVWDDPLNQDLMPYDRSFEPIILGQTLYVGFNDCDKVAAFDLKTGRQKWEYFVDGPVRLPLVGWQDKIYFSSDDGMVYCLSAAEGKLLWKFAGMPDSRKILGNKRLISMWPARGGVVIADGILYFANSIWPMMGTFIYALDAESGAVIWRNEETGADFIRQPHNYPAFAGIAPQGVFAVSGNNLLIPGGRSVPACFDRSTGKMHYYHLAKYGKTGGAFICATDSVFFNHDRDKMVNMFNLNTGELMVRRPGKYPVITEKMTYFSGTTLSGRSSAKPDSVCWEIKADASGDLILAGNHLFAGGNNTITMLECRDDETEPKIIWRKQIDGQVSRLIAANNYLIAVTEDGKIAAFSRDKEKVRYYQKKQEVWEPSDHLIRKVNQILSETNTREGYALLYGIGDGDLLAALTLHSDLMVIGVDPDIQKIDELRQRYNTMGLYGKRITLLQGNLNSVKFPPYFSSLTIVGDFSSAGFLPDLASFERLIWTARPYDGKIWLPLGIEQQETFITLVKKYKEERILARISNEAVLLTRSGPLPGSDDWTHQYGDIHNSVKSDDKRVKTPLGLLWFGGNSNLDVLPRHGHGPPEQVIDGRLIIEGMDVISARDVYTGRVLWKVPLDCLETFQMYYNETYTNTPLQADYNQRHIPGANGRGTNYVVSNDLVYILQGTECLVLDIQSGKIIKSLTLPALANNEKPEWGYIGLYENYLIAGSEFAEFSKLTPLSADEQKEINQLSIKKFSDLRDKTNYDLAASKKLIIMDRHSGKVLWQLDGRHGFIHNSIVAFGDRLYCLDKLPAFIESKMERRGMDLPRDYRLLSLNIHNGKVIWQSQKNVFGSWLGYSKETGLLLQATRPSGDMLAGEKGSRMIVYEGQAGRELWDKPVNYNNPPILHNAQIITDHTAVDIFSGEQILRNNPISMIKMPWTYTRTKGCNYNIASENLLSFRSSAAGYFDLKNDGGVGHFGGFKSGCTSNLVVADGVLNAPDYTRTCQCAYQNQTSLALIYMPDVEYWTTSDYAWDGQPVKKIGLNLNAPGDRMTEAGILWLDFPSVGGPSPDIPVIMTPANPTFIRRHSTFLSECKQRPWVSASGISGINSLEIILSHNSKMEETYTLRFYFTELEGRKAGERVFNVIVQDVPFLTDFDIAGESGGINREIVKTLRDVKVHQSLSIRFKSSEKAPASKAILSGIEIVANGYERLIFGDKGENEKIYKIE